MSSDEFLDLEDIVCAAKEHSITGEEILSSLVLNANDGEIDNYVMEEINEPPS